MQYKERYCSVIEKLQLLCIDLELPSEEDMYRILIVDMLDKTERSYSKKIGPRSNMEVLEVKRAIKESEEEYQREEWTDKEKQDAANSAILYIISLAIDVRIEDLEEIVRNNIERVKNMRKSSESSEELVQIYTREDIDRDIEKNKNQILNYIKDNQIKYAAFGVNNIYEYFRVYYDLKNELVFMTTSQEREEDDEDVIKEKAMGSIVEVYSFVSGFLQKEAEKLYEIDDTVSIKDHMETLIDRVSSLEVKYPEERGDNMKKQLKKYGISYKELESEYKKLKRELVSEWRYSCVMDYNSNGMPTLIGQIGFNEKYGLMRRNELVYSHMIGDSEEWYFAKRVNIIESDSTSGLAYDLLEYDKYYQRTGIISERAYKEVAKNYPLEFKELKEVVEELLVELEYMEDREDIE